MTISEARNILQNHLPAHPNSDVRYAGSVVNYALRQNLEQPWHPCKYEDFQLEHDGTWVDGRWYEWLDKYNNREVARMKLDAIDHFFPQTKAIKEEDVIAFRETHYNYCKRKAEEEGREFPGDGPMSNEYVYLSWSSTEILLRDSFEENRNTHYWRME